MAGIVRKLDVKSMRQAFGRLKILEDCNFTMSTLVRSSEVAWLVRRTGIVYSYMVHQADRLCPAFGMIRTNDMIYNAV